MNRPDDELSPAELRAYAEEARKLGLISSHDVWELERDLSLPTHGRAKQTGHAIKSRAQGAGKHEEIMQRIRGGDTSTRLQKLEQQLQQWQQNDPFAKIKQLEEQLQQLQQARQAAPPKPDIPEAQYMVPQNPWTSPGPWSGVPSQWSPPPMPFTVDYSMPSIPAWVAPTYAGFSSPMSYLQAPLQYAQYMQTLQAQQQPQGYYFPRVIGGPLGMPTTFMQRGMSPAQREQAIASNPLAYRGGYSHVGWYNRVDNTGGEQQ